MKYLITYNELTGSASYPYELVKTKNIILDDDETVTMITYKFKSKGGNIYTNILQFKGDDNHMFSVNFQDEDSYFKELDKDGIYDINYLNTNKGDAVMIISTVCNIIQDYYEKHKDHLYLFGFTVTEPKRLNIYKYYLQNMFPEWKLEEEEIKDNIHRLTCTKDIIFD